jgi:transmembrane sensor
VKTAYSKTLDDGTQVELDKNSSLTLLAGYNGKQRRIKLNGKATFKVEHDAGKPFIVEAGGVLIQDIGTAFEVKAQPDEDTVEVWVTEGIVEMFTENDTLRLTQNQRGYYVPALNKIYDERLLQQAIEDNSRIFHFSNTTLGEVIQQLNAVYPTPIRLSNAALERCRITVDFTNEPQEVVVEIIAETLGLQVERTHGKYTLKGEACNP